MAATNAPPSSRQQAEALIMEADAQGIVVMFRDDLVDILIKEIERADRAEQERDEAKREALRFAETYHDEFNVREGLASDLTAARERIAELERDRNFHVERANDYCRLNVKAEAERDALRAERDRLQARVNDLESRLR